MTSQESPLEAAIESELTELCDRVIPRAFGKLGKQDALPIPQLRQIVARCFPSEWESDRAAALEKALRLAASKLRGKFDEDSNMTAREAGFRLFNLEGAPWLPDVHPIALPHPDFGTTAYNTSLDKINNALPGALEATYKRILAYAPNAKIYVLGYPQVVANKSVSDADDIRHLPLIV